MLPFDRRGKSATSPDRSTEADRRRLLQLQSELAGLCGEEEFLLLGGKTSEELNFVLLTKKAFGRNSKVVQ